MPTISMFYGILIRMFFYDTDRHTVKTGTDLIIYGGDRCDRIKSKTKLTGWIYRKSCFSLRISGTESLPAILNFPCRSGKNKSWIEDTKSTKKGGWGFMTGRQYMRLS